MKAYKLFRELKDGSISSLFINKKARYPFNKWLEAECFPTKGFAVRPFWHCTSQPIAPHLSMKGRVWCEVEMKDYEEFKRPQQQGGLWFLAKKVKIIEKVKVHQTEDKLYVLHKNEQILVPGLIWSPYIPMMVDKPDEEYTKFMKEYHRMHALCPKCGASNHSSTLVGYILNLDKKEEYKDLNNCVCSNCGDKHTAHERVEDKNYKEEEHANASPQDFTPSKGISGRYAKKLVNSKFYGIVKIGES